MVPESFSVPPSLFLHHSHKVGLKLKEDIMYDFAERSYLVKAVEKGARNPVDVAVVCRSAVWGHE